MIEICEENKKKIERKKENKNKKKKTLSCKKWEYNSKWFIKKISNIYLFIFKTLPAWNFKYFYVAVIAC